MGAAVERDRACDPVRVGGAMKRRRWRVLRMRLRSLLRTSEVERELDKELRFHLEQQIEEARAFGLSAEEARSGAEVC